MNTELDTTLERYEAALQSLKGTRKIEVAQVLILLNARDVVQIALKEQKSIPTSRLQKVIELDALLREKAQLITKAVNNKKDKQLADWRESVQPSAEAWWWKLDNIAPPHTWDKLDWLWKLLSVVGWTANLSLLVTIATRFLGGGGVGLLGAAAVTLPSILALLQASSELTQAGSEGFEKLLEKLKIPKHYQQEAKLASTGIMFAILISFWFALPSVSKIYNSNGLKNYRKGDLGTAEKDYQQAISLDEDNIEAHYNLGNLYEDWLEFDQAKKQYQIAVADGLPQAYNNLGRLYIQEKKYSQAAVLLAKGLVLTEEKNSTPEVKYSLLKNLGWARLEQNRYEEAQQTLQAAIGITRNPDAKNYIPNPGAAHCLLAQTLEKLKQPKALEQWQQCSHFGSRLNADEDTWLYLAKEKLSKSKVSKAGK
ncbi:tetratricopeptide repeat protein [Nostoc sp. FACHB-87]|uniref:tetratricopeptide repeat protein n=1 Tax=Nostocaceae TaxID=1162 RepID=UPI001683EE3B|nr:MULTISPECIES: tetratricopeptide repeat protein [Nostocaceae]MBD2458863.1 tetratricopeptide repeat protein [Nostoc sp. FACHB-87]MBD2479896.1 tetratricopeptide repeat protein [Anabaena sp. FACHB-83]